MIFFTKWKAERTKRRELEQEQALAELKKKEKAALLQVERATLRMTSKSCPVRNGSNCFEGCVHFKAGYARVGYWLDGPYIITDNPSCKLWKTP